MALARVVARVAHDHDRTPTERGRRVGGIGHREATVAEAPSRSADDAGPDPADDDVEASRLRPGERRRRRCTAWTSPSRHGATAIAVSSSCRVLSRRTVSDSATGRAPPPSCAYATRTPVPMPATTGASWLCRPQQTTGKPVELLGQPRRAPRRTPRPPDRACTAVAITCARRRRPQAESPRQVRVDDVEAAGAELEIAGLGVDEHRVTDLDRPGLPRVGDARRSRRPRSGSSSSSRWVTAVTVPQRSVSATSCPPAQRSTIASVTSTIPSRSATAIRSSAVWMSVIPFARFTHGRPRSLKTFASAPPPENAVVGS